MTGCCIVITTTDKADIAEVITNALVEKNLAKCVWQDQISSTYLWEGKIVRDSEYRVMAKCTKDKSAEVITFIKEMHNYSTPGIIEINIDNGDPQYINWLKGT